MGSDRPKLLCYRELPGLLEFECACILSHEHPTRRYFLFKIGLATPIVICCAAIALPWIYGYTEQESQKRRDPIRKTGKIFSQERRERRMREKFTGLYWEQV